MNIVAAFFSPFIEDHQELYPHGRLVVTVAQARGWRVMSPSPDSIEDSSLNLSWLKVGEGYDISGVVLVPLTVVQNYEVHR
ncbi:UNVERIFIED_CONTAM: hypothetical protein NCL1_04690 [Trichonephila clavipes]